MSKFRKRVRRLEAQLEAAGLIPDTRSPAAIVRAALSPDLGTAAGAPKAITIRPDAEVVAVLDACAQELKMSRNSLAVELLSSAVRECLDELPETHRKRACEAAADTLGLPIDWERSDERSEGVSDD